MYKDNYLDSNRHHKLLPGRQVLSDHQYKRMTSKKEVVVFPKAEEVME